jgi:DNA-binding MarR family transcriptional regulator
MANRWLTDEERVAWVRLAAVVELLPGVLDTQLRRDADLSHFEYFVLAMLSEAPERTLRMTSLASRTNATLPRLSHVVRRLEDRGLVRRFPCPEDGRATNAQLTEAGWQKVRDSAPGHVAHVRSQVIDALDAEQVRQLAEITEAILGRIDPDSVVMAPQRDTSQSPVAERVGAEVRASMCGDAHVVRSTTGPGLPWTVLRRRSTSSPCRAPGRTSGPGRA